MSKTAIQYQATIEKDRSRIDTNEHKDEKTSREQQMTVKKRKLIESLPFPFSSYSTKEANWRRLPIRRHFLRFPFFSISHASAGEGGEPEDLVVRLYSSFLV